MTGGIGPVDRFNLRIDDDVTATQESSAVLLGSAASATLLIFSTGSPLTVSGISYPSQGFSGSWSGVVPAGGFQSVPVTFAPTRTGAYTGRLDVNTSQGVSSVSLFGTGSQ